MRGLLDLLLPSLCPLCMCSGGPALCAPCREELPRLEAPCPFCAMPHPGLGPCPACGDGGLPHIAAAVAGWAYAGGLERLVGQAKAGARPAAVAACAHLMPEVTAEGATLVVPVPPSPGRRPGPHLGSALAKAVARRLDLPCRPLLRVTRRAAAQHRLGATARERNVAGLFTVRGAVPERVLLVDDLLTSGATASSAAGALRAAGAKEVTLVVLARTLTW